VQPVELAHKLAKEMEENQMVSVSRVYVPNHYRVFLSPRDREQFASYEPALRKELSDYQLEHARQERLALTSRPQVEFHTDDRLERGQALLIAEGRRNVLTGDHVMVGRSRDCDVVVSDPNVSRRHIELRRGERGWAAIDLGSTNGMKVNGRRLSHAELERGDRITIGITDLTCELE